MPALASVVRRCAATGAGDGHRPPAGRVQVGGGGRRRAVRCAGGGARRRPCSVKRKSVGLPGARMPEWRCVPRRAAHRSSTSACRASSGRIARVPRLADRGPAARSRWNVVDDRVQPEVEQFPTRRPVPRRTCRLVRGTRRAGWRRRPLGRRRRPAAAPAAGPGRLGMSVANTSRRVGAPAQPHAG